MNTFLNNTIWLALTAAAIYTTWHALHATNQNLVHIIYTLKPLLHTTEITASAHPVLPFAFGAILARLLFAR